MKKSTSFLFMCALLGAVWCPLAGQTAATPASPRPRLVGEKREAKYFMAPSLATALVSPDQSPEVQARADEAWAHLFDPVDGRSLEFVNEKGEPSSLMLGDTQSRQGNWVREPKKYAWNERARSALRERGLKFWEDFPQDVRRYVWLFETGSTTVFYWRDIDAGAQAFVDWLNDKSTRTFATTPVDLAAKARWEIRYLGLRAEFLASTVIDERAKVALRLRELERRLFAELQLNKIPESVPEAEVALRWTDFCKDLLDLADRYPSGALGYTPSTVVQMLERDAKSFPEMYPLLKQNLLAAAKLGANDDLKDYAFAAAAEPVELEIGQPVPGLKFTTLKNQSVDRKVWHGKVVLVDFWAFWCHSCIESMPHLKTLYDKYHDQGFEIYGVCFAEKNETAQKIVDLMAKMNIPWEQSMRESLRNDRFGRIYSFTSLPQLMLLDKNGNLAARNIYNYAELEAKIQELLAQKGPE